MIEMVATGSYILNARLSESPSLLVTLGRRVSSLDGSTKAAHKSSQHVR
jgi:hypothetical protein